MAAPEPFSTPSRLIESLWTLLEGTSWGRPSPFVACLSADIFEGEADIVGWNIGQVCMLTQFPSAVPEVPVSNVDKAAEYYVNVLGFNFDWGNDQGGIGGISQGDCRMFLTNGPFRQHYGSSGKVTVWLNLEDKQQVDELYHRWRDAGAKILAEPEDKPWRLREFMVADLDGNRLRVFYDFSWQLPEAQA